MDLQRVALIRYRTAEGDWSVGSGLFIGDHKVLTADHVVDGTEFQVVIEGRELTADLLVRSGSQAVDLAVLKVVDAPLFPLLGYARVNVETITQVPGCTVVGFPRFKKDDAGNRRSAQVAGFVPTAEGHTRRDGAGLRAEFLTFRITDDTARDAPLKQKEDLTSPTSPWGGMSGAVVYGPDERVLGVVRHHSPAEGTAALAMTPITAIDDLPPGVAENFRVALGIPDTYGLPVVPDARTHALLRDGLKLLLLSKDYRIFRGRQDATQRIEAFLAGPGGLLAVTAPAGLGKTALLAHLVRSDPHRYAYHFFSVQNGAWLGEKFFLRSMLQQLAPASTREELHQMELEELQGAFANALTNPPDGAGRVILIDGLDEVQDWNLDHYLKVQIPEDVHVIVSIRDTGQDWRTQYGLSDAGCLPLEGLDEEAVAGIFTATGTHAAWLIDQPHALGTVMAKAAYTPATTDLPKVRTARGADPIYVRFLAEDTETRQYTLEQLQNEPAALSGYLNNWWEALIDLDMGKPAQKLIEFLVAAKGNLLRSDLTALIPELFDDPWDTGGFDKNVLPSIRRFVAGNEDSGYFLAHPRLGQHLAQGALARGLAHTRRDLLDYCADWPQNDSRYALGYLPCTWQIPTLRRCPASTAT